MNTLIADCTLIDGTGRDPVERAGIWLRDERIAWAGPLADRPADAREAEEIDASGKTAIPALIDAHIHVCWNGRESIQALLHRERDLLLLEAVQTLGNILASGTTTVRDVGGHDYMEMSLRRGVEAGHIAGPRLLTSGKIICMTGGHGYFAAREADGPDEMRKAAREQIKRGADTVKMMATGGAATPGQDVQASQLTVDEMAAAVSAAHAMGRTAAAHCHGTQGIKNALLAGMDSIEHGTYLTEETADLMVETDAALVLTLGVARPDVDNLPPGERAEVERMLAALEGLDERVHETIHLARQKGVLIGSGSDAGGNPLAPHDFSMARELETLVEHGVPPLEALTIATRNNARILRRQDDLGTLEAGKLADLVLLDADPLADIANVRRVAAVYKAGRRVA